MKNILYTFSLLLLISSCNDDFLDALPKGQAIPENSDQLAEMLNDKESVNKHGSILGLMTDQLVLIDHFHNEDTYRQMGWADYPYNEFQDDPHWNQLYQAANTANYVINNIDGVEQKDGYDPKETKARAYFIRANSYFILINSYAKHWSSSSTEDLGVPLILDFDLAGKHARATVGAVYEQIFLDLEAALPNLPELPQFKSNQSKAGVYALYGRIYLYQGNYEKAAEYCRKALDLQDYICDFKEGVFNGPLVIMGFQPYISSPHINPERIYTVTSDPQNSVFIQDFVDQHRVGDLRKKFFIQPEFAPWGIQANMAANFANSQDASLTVPEAILNYCEALLKKDNPDASTALEYLNKLRLNRYEDGTDLPESNLLDEVLYEREMELRHSALRFWDMKRFGVSASKELGGVTYSIAGNSKNYVLPIPPKVMEVNDLLVQNPREGL